MSFIQDELKQAVTNVLMSSQTGKIKPFTVSGQTLVAALYKALAAGFPLVGMMSVEYDPTFDGAAEYDSETNTMKLGFTSIKRDSQRGMVIHESTHAVCDMIKTLCATLI